MPKKKRVLDGYKRDGKKFTSPLKTMSGGFREVDYIGCILPEIVWLQYLVDSLGRAEGIRVAIEFLKLCHEREDEGALAPCFLSCLREFSDDDWSYILEELNQQDIAESLRYAVKPFVTTFPDNNPLRALVGDIGEVSDADVESARSAVSTLFSRHSQDSLLTQAIVTAYSLTVGRLSFSEQVRFPDLESIDKDFGSPEAKHASSFVRQFVNASFSCGDITVDRGWAEYFWNCAGRLIEFEALPRAEEEDYSEFHPYEVFAINLSNKVKVIQADIWNALPIDYCYSEPYEVIGALLSRQCTLTIKLCNPSLWDWQSGPMFLRALVDNYITVAWILKDPLDRSRKFIDYGLGQEKLQLEHMKAEFDSMADLERKTELEESIEARVAWLNDQHWEFLQGVDVGAWSGISTRQMAEEADCLELYRFGYSPYSQAAHGTWNHVSRFNARRSRDPLKKHIFSPSDLQSSDFNIMINGIKYLDMIFEVIIAHFGLKLDWQSIYDWANSEAYKLVEALKIYQEGQSVSFCG